VAVCCRVCCGPCRLLCVWGGVGGWGGWWGGGGGGGWGGGGGGGGGGGCGGKHVIIVVISIGVLCPEENHCVVQMVVRLCCRRACASSFGLRVACSIDWPRES